MQHEINGRLGLLALHPYGYSRHYNYLDQVMHVDTYSS